MGEREQIRQQEQLQQQSRNDSMVYVFPEPRWSSQCRAYHKCAQLAMEQNHTWGPFIDHC
jgi:hypothetical protein